MHALWWIAGGVTFFSFLPLLSAQEAEFRVWTDLENRQLEAALEKREEEWITLRMRNGQVARVPVQGLSQGDQNWLQKLDNPEPAAPSDEYTGPPAEADWPRIVNPSENATSEVISEDPDKKEFIYESANYRFICDTQLSTSLVREFSEVFEVTWLVNCLLPLDLRPIPEPGREKYVARIFTNRRDYANAGGVPGSAGIYSPGDRELKLPISSLGVKSYGNKLTVDYGDEDYDTLIHEITHQVMNRWLPRMPVWMIEGTAEYVGLADYDNGRFSFIRQDDRLEQHLQDYFGHEFPMVPIEDLMTMSHAEWSAGLQSGAAGRNYASALVLVFFFYHLDGEEDAAGFKAYLRAAEKMQRGDSYQELMEQHLLRGRSYAELEEEVLKAFRKKGIKLQFF